MLARSPSRSSRIASMETNDSESRSSHWDAVYRSKGEQQLSWHQDAPGLSLDLIRRRIARGATVLDIGGGTSRLAAQLSTELGVQASVLDLSAAALERARERAGTAASSIRWLVGDVCGEPWPIRGAYDLWHDRAVFHFLTEPAQRRIYLERALEHVRPGGFAVLATFALDGPEQCSALAVQRYDASSLAACFAPGFELVEAARETHTTPWGGEQPFTYVVLQRAAQR
jgi:SAM-dependent methyltransferase